MRVAIRQINNNQIAKQVHLCLNRLFKRCLLVSFAPGRPPTPEARAEGGKQVTWVGPLLLSPPPFHLFCIYSRLPPVLGFVCVPPPFRRMRGWQGKADPRRQRRGKGPGEVAGLPPVQEKPIPKRRAVNHHHHPPSSRAPPAPPVLSDGAGNLAELLKKARAASRGLVPGALSCLLSRCVWDYSQGMGWRRAVPLSPPQRFQTGAAAPRA